MSAALSWQLGGAAVGALLAAPAFLSGPAAPATAAEGRRAEGPLLRGAGAPGAAAERPLPGLAPVAGGAAAGLAVLAAVGSSRRGRGRGRSAIPRASAPSGKVGTRILFHDTHEGTVRYFGSVAFADGDWAGVELDKPVGMHNGTVMGTFYFECEPKHGVFCKATDLEPDTVKHAPGSPAAGGASAGGSSAFAVGQKVMWHGTHSGTVRFVGSTSFAAGEWVGVELDDMSGMHDGTVMGVEYFTCALRKGVFCLPAQLQVTGGAPAGAGGSPAAKPAAAAPAISVGQKVMWSGKHQGTVRFVGPTNFAAGEWVGVELDQDVGMHNGSVLGIEYFTTSGPKKGVMCQASQLKVL